MRSYRIIGGYPEASKYNRYSNPWYWDSWSYRRYNNIDRKLFYKYSWRDWYRDPPVHLKSGPKFASAYYNRPYREVFDIKRFVRKAGRRFRKRYWANQHRKYFVHFAEEKPGLRKFQKLWRKRYYSKVLEGLKHEFT